MPAALIAIIERFCQEERTGTSTQDWGGEPVIGAAYGPLAGMLSLARELGLERALGKTRQGRLALFLVLARVIHRGSRLSSVRWAESQAVSETLGLEPFDEDDLYEALDWIADQQADIEKALAPASLDFHGGELT